MMETIVMAAVLAYIVSYVTDYGKGLWQLVAANKPVPPAVCQVMALVLSIAAAVSTGTDVFGAVGVSFGVPAVGVVLTGLVISKGSNAVYDVMDNIRNLRISSDSTAKQ